MYNLSVKMIGFFSFARGGYKHVFAAVNYKGITGEVFRDDKNSPVIKRFYYRNQEFQTVEGVIKAYRRNPPLTVS